MAQDDIKGVQSQLEGYIQHEIARYKVEGLSVALVDDQKIVWASGFGWADAAAKIPAGPDTRYRVGSISKLFTDTAAMQLVAEGRLDLDAPVQNTLPWFSIGSAWPNTKPITLRQLMAHHSGLPRDVMRGMWLKEATSPEHDFRAMLRTLGQTQVDAPPERMFSYSNVGLDVVGAMVETASGQPFEQRLQESVLAPLDMKGAQFSATMPADATMAQAYFKGKAKSEQALRDIPAGGLTASVTDLARFLMMQFSGGRNREGAVVLPAAQQAAMLQPQYPGLALDADTRIGLGWMLSDFNANPVRGGGPVAWHSGATFYFRSQMMMLPEQKLGVVVLSNDGAAGGVVDGVARRALALLLEARKGIRQAPDPGFVPSVHAWTNAQWQSVQTACAGDYLTLMGGVASLKPKGSRLSVRYGQRQFEVREGEAGRLGLRYRLLGLFPVKLGPLSEIGFECTQIDGRHVLLGVLGGERILIGERLPKPSLPAEVARWTGRYRARLLEGEVPTIDPTIRVFQDDGRLWAELRSQEVFGGQKVRVLLQPISETALRGIGPLSDMGPVIEIEKGKTPRFRFSGWTFERVAQ
ncbi:MAG: beta-lactamase family protein [Burkholderiaceae bacterium]|nr:beta-lactamase family protein [Burkholderiaceae bacterium]